jgi:hypothetical protein
LDNATKPISLPIADPPGDQSPGYQTTPPQGALAGFIRRRFLALEFGSFEKGLKSNKSEVNSL